MRKIPTLFMRDPQDRAHVLPQITPSCEWVLFQGRPTRKFDGTCVGVSHSGVYVRREVRPGACDVPPDFHLVETDPVTGKHVGWTPAAQSPFWKFIAEATVTSGVLEPGTYELCGPKVNGNPEGFDRHHLIRHGSQVLDPFWPPASQPTAEEAYRALAEQLPRLPYEGVVWHHPDRRMAKLKVRDIPKAR